MSDVKQVKVDNWGIYFLQRLKHFFNRTDYCDLTLQFHDNAQLKVHRLVLNACTEYFELLERTCEMYEDCLVMPEDLQADVVVPIVNFMYTGQLEFKTDLLEKLYQTSLIMNMPVLTKLLDSHRNVAPPKSIPAHSYGKRLSKNTDVHKSAKQIPTASTSGKRSHSKAFDDKGTTYRDKNVYLPQKKTDSKKVYRAPSPLPYDSQVYTKKSTLVDPRPTRYELPEELDTDNVFDSSFTSISYTSSPLMIHPEVKQYTSKRSGLFGETLGKKYGGTVNIVDSKKKYSGMSTVDIVECKKVSKSNNIFEDSIAESLIDETELFPSNYIKNEVPKVSNQLFDQILDSEGPNVTIEKDNKTANNLDHAKIISEVLKKYPHLVKSNKNIKLKILNTPSKPKKQIHVKEKLIKPKTEAVEADFTYETDVLDSKEAAKLIALGAENVTGPWICLICGTPGKALHFTSYYKFRRHLVEIHNEKPVITMCEYCGLKSLKRNCLLHHLYTKHGIKPPPTYHFPKCNQCDYIGLTEALLIKHKMSHSEARNFRCNVCDETFGTSQQILKHIQKTGHKYSAERKTNLQCVYCLKVFLRQTNLYAHLKTNHKNVARKDGIIEDSDEEREIPKQKLDFKYELPVTFDNEYEEIDMQYQIQHKSDGNIHLISRKLQESPSKQKILNADFSISKPMQMKKVVHNNMPTTHTEYLQNEGSISPDNNQENEDIVMIDNSEYIVRDHQLIPKQETAQANEEYIISDIMETAHQPISQTMTPSTTMEYANIQTSIADSIIQQPNMIIKNATNLNQPIQIVVSNEEEYKALMASNHPIIFDNGDANKTLTVLTAPHTGSLDTRTIELNNTQSNNMMIIQEDYPLNVTETVASENSNIVVVYSHHVDQNKQYQLITPENIGHTQFVQSSAIITQNYETVTTSTPVMSAHVLDTQGVWENNVSQHNEDQHIMQVTSETELHSVVEQEVPPIENETNTVLNELPEVQLIPVVQNSLPDQDNIVENTMSQPIDIITEDIPSSEPQNDEPIQNTSSTPMDIDTSSDMIIEKDKEIENINERQESQVLENINESQESQVLENINESQESQVLENINESQESQVLENINESQESQVLENINESQESQVLENTNEIQESQVLENTNENQESQELNEIMPQEKAFSENPNINDTSEQLESECITEQISDKISEKDHSEETDVIASVPENVEYTTNIDGEPCEVLENIDIAETTSVPTIDKEIPKETVEKIQNLTSEWSEDESEIVSQDDNTAEIHTQDNENYSTSQGEKHNIVEDIEQNESTIADEVEESIENIQQEVDKQLAETMVHPVEVEEDNLPNNQKIEKDQGMIQTNGNVDISNQKISSILNDWDDNDSQEEVSTDSINDEGTQPTSEVIKNAPEDMDNVILTDKTEPIKDDKIKSLVSDWDDDEEDGKEEN